MSIKYIFNPAGGIYYHLKARRFQQKLWNPYKQAVARFLSSWNPQQRKLLIFGGSGGYSLDKSFLERFQSITLLDPDPLASWFFNRQHKIKVKHVKKNYLANGPHQLAELSRDFPEHAFLFTNVLGQLPYLLAGNSSTPQLVNDVFSTAFHQKSWASYHDLFSFHFDKASPNICWPLLYDAKSAEDAQNKLLQQCQLRPLKANIIDHSTVDLFFFVENHQRMLWLRTPFSYHIIDGCFQSC